MNSLNNLLRNTLPALAIAALASFGLTSCSEAPAENIPSPPVMTVSDLSPHFEEEDTLMEFSELEEAPAELTSRMSVLEASACQAVENHAPVAEALSFSEDIDKVWIYSKIKMPKGEAGTVKHIYSLNGKEVQTVELDVKGPTFRTRSYKTIHPGMIGDWTVEIVSEEGLLLDTVSFSIEPAFVHEPGC